MGATVGAQMSPEHVLADLLEGRLRIQEACDWVAGLLSTGANTAQASGVSPAPFIAHFLEVIRADADGLFKEHLRSPQPSAGAAAALQAHEPQSLAATPNIQSSELFPSLPMPAPKVCSPCKLLPTAPHVIACWGCPESDNKVCTQSQQLTTAASAGKRVAPSPVTTLTRDALFAAAAGVAEQSCRACPRCFCCC